jgi:hypothetical protein
MILNIGEIDLATVDGGGRLFGIPLPHPEAVRSTAVYNDMVLNGIEVDGGYVAWHPVVEARAIFVKGFVATKINRAFLWHEGGPTGECLVVPCVPDEFCAPEMPDEMVVPSGGKPC